MVSEFHLSRALTWQPNIWTIDGFFNSFYRDCTLNHAFAGMPSHAEFVPHASSSAKNLSSLATSLPRETCTA